MLDQKAMTLWNDAEKWSHSHPGCFTRKVKLAMLTVHVSVLASWSRDGFFIPSHTGHWTWKTASGSGRFALREVLAGKSAYFVENLSGVQKISGIFSKVRDDPRKMIPEQWSLNNDSWTMIPEQRSSKNDSRTMIPEKWSLNNDLWTMIPEQWSPNNDLWKMMSTGFGRTPSFLSWYYLFHNISLEELRKKGWNICQLNQWSCLVSNRALLQRTLENLLYFIFLGSVLGKTERIKVIVQKCETDNLEGTKQENKIKRTDIRTNATVRVGPKVGKVQ